MLTVGSVSFRNEDIFLNVVYTVPETVPVLTGYGPSIPPVPVLRYTSISNTHPNPAKLLTLTSPTNPNCNCSGVTTRGAVRQLPQGAWRRGAP